MLSIAICDDNTATTTAIENMLYKMGDAQNIRLNCDVFFDGSTLLQHICQGFCYDLIYLDIEMKNMNGISAARQIRKMDIPALIVYITCHEKYIKDLFSTEPIGFLDKPINEKDFYKVFETAYNRIRQRSGYFTFSYNKSYTKIPLKNICYFESDNRVVYVHTIKNTACSLSSSDKLKFYGKINDIEKGLSDHNTFIRIHQSYLINFDHIEYMSYTTVLMSNGKKLKISEDHRKNVQIQFCSLADLER